MSAPVSSLSLAGLILPLALDTFAVSAAIGLVGLTPRQRLRISVVFAAVEGGTPAIGLLLGGPLGALVGSTADYVAIGILLAFGVWTLRPGGDDDEEGSRVARLAGARGLPLLLLGLSVSLDELAVGFTLGLLRLPVLPVLTAIALQTFGVTQLGLRLGGRVSPRVRESAERLAGVALVGLAALLLARRLAG